MPSRVRNLASCAVIASIGAATACAGINTDRLLGVFNNGGLDSIADPNLSRDEIAQERALLTARRTLIGAYWDQGPNSQTAQWLVDPDLRTLARRRLQFRIRLPIGPGASGNPPPVPQAAPAVNQVAFLESGPAEAFAQVALLRLEQLGLPMGPRCQEGGTPDSRFEVGMRQRDAIRLVASLENMADALARLVDDRVVTEQQALDAVDVATAQAAAYLRTRSWKPSVNAPTLGIVVKGGASTGVYSAGVAWRALTLLQRYRQWFLALPADEQAHYPKPSRFKLSAGTSAGAIVAAMVDMFDQETCRIDPRATEFIRRHSIPPATAGEDPMGSGQTCQEYARQLLATSFTLTTQQSMYCLDSRFLAKLASVQKGLMDFAGLRRLMGIHIREQALINETELVLTTVDFRYGELYVQSDQDPSTTRRGTCHAVSDVIENIEASFVLPFISWPTRTLTIHGKRRDGVFLDGGIKSELPVIALADRGVERALVVGSSVPRITPVEQQYNALTIAARYLDVSLSAVTEAEWEAAIPLAQATAAREAKVCQLLNPNEAFCKGDLLADCGGASVDHSFQTLGIFRPEHVDPTNGYSFDPQQMKRLFAAGAESVRSNCREVAQFLGLPNHASFDEQLNLWCNERPVLMQELEEGDNPSIWYPICQIERGRGE